jgi:hypothetical protein
MIKNIQKLNEVQQSRTALSVVTNRVRASPPSPVDGGTLLSKRLCFLNVRWTKYKRLVTKIRATRIILGVQKYGGRDVYLNIQAQIPVRKW